MNKVLIDSTRYEYDVEDLLLYDIVYKYKDPRNIYRITLVIDLDEDDNIINFDKYHEKAFIIKGNEIDPYPYIKDREHYRSSSHEYDVVNNIIVCNGTYQDKQYSFDVSGSLIYVDTDKIPENKLKLKELISILRNDNYLETLKVISNDKLIKKIEMESELMYVEGDINE